MMDIRTTNPRLYKPVKTERVKTGRGYLFALLQWLNWTRLARLLVRSQWHVADDVAPDGTVVKPVHIQPNKTPMTKLMSIRLKGPDMKLWQQVPGTKDVRQVVYEPTGTKNKRAKVDPTMPLVAALNRKNALRKLGLKR